MTSLHVQSVVNVLHDAGLQLALTHERALKVKPASSVTPVLRDLIVASRADLIELLSREAANDMDLDRWCWPYSEAMNAAEIETFTVRLIHFVSRGATGAEAMADLLVRRDRQQDERNLCVECRGCRPGLRCSRGLAVLDVLQRCDNFDHHPDLERLLP